MTHEEKVHLALRAIDKRWNFEQLYYGDDLYGHEDDADSVWALVDECLDIGRVSFKQKYEQIIRAE